MCKNIGIFRLWAMLVDKGYQKSIGDKKNQL